MANTPTAPHYEFNAGAYCLDFVNTVWERVGYSTSRPAEPHELIFSFGDLVTWAKGAEILPRSILDSVARSALRDPKGAEREFKRLIQLREALFGTILALVSQQRDLPEQLEILNSFIADLPAQKLTPVSRRLVVEESLDAGDLRHISTALCRDAVQLLSSPDLSRLRFCCADDCGWVFWDTSKNNKRRWCNMSDCGNRDKVSRFLERKRGND